MQITNVNFALGGMNVQTWDPPPYVPPTYYLWSWGYNGSGALGVGNNINRSSPVQIGALTTWLKIAAGYDHNLAITTDGALWSWGYNNSGRLGLGNTTSVSSPVQIGALTTWSSIDAGDYHNMAVKTDGTLWAWGVMASANWV